jgi:hypothetical protein
VADTGVGLTADMRAVAWKWKAAVTVIATPVMMAAAMAAMPSSLIC